MQLKVQQLVEEARQKAEMHPLEMESKRAAAEFNRANALKMGQEKPVNPMHDASSQEKFQSILQPYIEAIQAETDTTKREAMRQQLIDQSKKYNFPLDNFIDSPAFKDSMAKNKEVAKLLHGAAANQTRVVVQGMGDASRERVATIRGEFAAKNAGARAAKEKTPTSYEAAAVAYGRMADEAELAGDEQKYNFAKQKQAENHQLAIQKSSASAATTAEEKAKMADRIMGSGQGRSGIIGDKSGGKPDTLFKAGDRREKDGVWYVRQADGKWLPEKK
jgi:hypothetical protein